MNSAVFLWIRCAPGALLFLLISSPGADARVRIEVIKSGSVFVEDQPTAFVCRPSHVTRYSHFIWFIDESNTSMMSTRKLDFRLPFKKNSEARIANLNGENVFNVSMRRDFSYQFVWCLVFEVVEGKGSQNFRGGFYQVPKVRETIPIKEVVFRHNHMGLGEIPKFYCDVRSEVSPRQVFLKSVRTFTPATRQWQLKDEDWTRYEIVSPTSIRVQKKHNGKRVQCVASTKDYRSNIGNVLSKPAVIVVHYVRFQPEPISVKPQSATGVALNFKVLANPAPQRSNFSVTIKGHSGKEIPVQAFLVFIKQVSLSHTPEKAFDIFIGCDLPRSGDYSVKYSSYFVRAEKAFSFVREETIQETTTKTTPRGNFVSKTPKMRERRMTLASKSFASPAPHLPSSSASSSSLLLLLLLLLLLIPLIFLPILLLYFRYLNRRRRRDIHQFYCSL